MKQTSLFCRRRVASWLSGIGVVLIAMVVEAQPVDYQRDVQPLLAEYCVHCHGGDAATREGGLRLDVREPALLGGDSEVAAIVPGKPDESELIRRVTCPDDDEVMPPAEQNKRLNSDQIEVLKRWISEGANYSAHWAFVAPIKAALPLPEPTHPIDAFVLARVRAAGLEPAQRAESHKLCRRLYLDLIGLPPSPQELDAFDQQGLEATIDKLLASERFGEKWARYWLDAARYSDTNGYEKDMPRDQWTWREWVVRALNRDMPYNEFIIEQIAGDLLPNATQDQVVATGFLRNSMLNEEGAIIAEQFRMVEMFDRMDCVGKAVLGLTTQCAQCHSHKFDPLTQDEYYGMFACINNVHEAQSWVYTAEQQTEIERIRGAVQAIEDRLRSERPSWQTDLAVWEATATQPQVTWTPLEATEMGSISGLNHPTQESDKSFLMRGHPSADVFMIGSPELKGVTGLRLEALSHGDLPFGGPGRSGTGTFGVTEIEALIRKPDSKDWEKLKLVNASADYSEPEQKQPDGKNARGPVALLIDGTDETAWRADRGAGRRNQPSVAVVQFETPLDSPTGTQFKFVLRTNDMLGCCRASLTTVPQPVAPTIDHAAVLAMQTPAAERTTEQQRAIFLAWCKATPELKVYQDEMEALFQSYPSAPTSVLHLAERQGDKVRTTHFLDRGGWDQPRQAIAPHTPPALHACDWHSGPARLAFARWLAAPQSPLTARVAVNRIWQALFGTGLVETPEDFGTRAPIPEYRELLDWLAVDFLEHGWSQKHIIRTIVMSATYQQSSAVTPALLERDPRNRLWARGPRFRTDAEEVRDIALSVSGLITHRLGGASLIPPVPQNVLDYNYTYPSYWTPTQGPDRYRRTLYVFRKRSMPDPVLNCLDAPNGDSACVRRARSNTPLSALTGLNETIFVEAAQALALRTLREAEPGDRQRAAYAFRLCTARVPSEAECDEIVSLLASQRTRLAEGWLSIREVATGDATKLPELPPQATPQDVAAWTLVARVLLNLDETMTKD